MNIPVQTCHPIKLLLVPDRWQVSAGIAGRFHRNTHHYIIGNKILYSVLSLIKLHRADGPAIEWAGSDGIKEGYKEGLRHRANGPAVEWDDGSKEWYKEGKLHREDGPAIEYADGKKEYWLNGMEYKEEQYYEKIKKQELKKNVKKERNSSIEL